ncbi:MAG: phage shock protein operon transcriptional activator [Deltaproteobacteria bacterium RIFOXYA12_FULL_61_11]|nr:MAG: phage shock protein operon transcriptional activator [Deltaproteobacteria bacterium RIFOXYA12_FULL_61_11]
MTTHVPILGESEVLQRMLEQVSKLAKLNRPVLIIGERGTGKELVAARLHYLSPRWDQSLVKLNCAALPEELLDSELFGHEAGAFTGAVRRRAGRFERADHGTLFLDELAATSQRLQEKILRVIEYGELERVGAEQTLTVDVRVIAATNVDLPVLAAAGRFRHDLLDRLAFDVVTLPPLRARGRDVVLLAEHFAMRMVRELGGECFEGFSGEVQEQLLAHPWPGNVRELRNTVERAVYRSLERGGPIDEVKFDPFASPFRLGPGPRGLPGASLEAGPPPMETEPEPEVGGLLQQVATFERGLLVKVLERCRHHQGRTAKALGLSYHQLRGLLRKHGLIGPARQAERGT